MSKVKKVCGNTIVKAVGFIVRLVFKEKIDYDHINNLL